MKYTKQLKSFVKLVILGITIVLIFTGLFYQFDHTHFNGLNDKNDKNIIHKIFNRFYFSVTTLSSAGYGDITPITIETKILSILLQFVLIISLMSALSFLIY